MRKMKKTTALLSILLVGTIFLGTIPSNSSAQANVPQWTEGKTWAMGGKMDLGQQFNPILDALKQEAHAGGVSFDADIDGETGLYEVYKVTDVSATEYNLHAHIGAGLHVSGSYSASGDMDGEKISISGKGYFDWSLDIQGDAKVEKESLAIKEINVKATMEVKAHYKGTYPEEKYDPNTYEGKVETKSLDVSIDGSITVEYKITYDPPLDVFDFPIEVGETWYVDSTATMSGKVSGSLDIKGLPPEMEKELENEFNITLPYSGETTLPTTTVPVSFSLQCTGTDTVKLPDGRTVEVYVIIPYYDTYDYYDDYYYGYSTFAVGSEPAELLYSPDEGFIVSQRFNMPLSPAPTGGTTGGTTSGTGTTTFALEPMTETQAEEGMKEIQKMPLRLDTWMIILIVVAVVGAIVAVALVLRSKKKKKAMAQMPPPYAQYPTQQYPGYQQPAPGHPPQAPPGYPPQQPYPPQTPPQQPPAQYSAQPQYQQYPPQQYPPQQPPQQPPQAQYQQPPQQYAQQPYPPQTPPQQPPAQYSVQPQYQQYPPQQYPPQQPPQQPLEQQPQKKPEQEKTDEF